MADVRHCCEDIERYMRACATCLANGKEETCPDRFIDYDEQFDEYGILDKLRPGSIWCIQYCPWCGTRFRPSKRDRWFDELEAMGIGDPWGDDRDRVPDEYRTAEWWLAKEN